MNFVDLFRSSNVYYFVAEYILHSVLDFDFVLEETEIE